jgi:hypothetical protein
MAKDRSSCTLCTHFSVIEGQPGCLKRPKVHEREDFPFKDTDCRFYHYVFDFSKLYDRGPIAPTPKD